MRHISVILTVLLAGCATNNLERLSANAKECVNQAAITNSVQSKSGVVVDATKEQRTECWAAWNARSEWLFELSERRRIKDEFYAGYRAICGNSAPMFDGKWNPKWPPHFLGCLDRWSLSD